MAEAGIEPRAGGAVVVCGGGDVGTWYCPAKFVLGYLVDGDVLLYALDPLRGGLLDVGEVDGSIDMRSINPLRRSRSLSACPFALLARSCSI